MKTAMVGLVGLLAVASLGACDQEAPNEEVLLRTAFDDAVVVSIETEDGDILTEVSATQGNTVVSVTDTVDGRRTIEIEGEESGRALTTPTGVQELEGLHGAVHRIYQQTTAEPLPDGVAAQDSIVCDSGHYGIGWGPSFDVSYSYAECEAMARSCGDKRVILYDRWHEATLGGGEWIGTVCYWQ